MTPDALRGMRATDAAITCILRRLDYLPDPLFQGRADPNPFFGPIDAPSTD